MDPVLKRLHDNYKETKGEAERRAFVLALLDRELIQGHEIRLRTDIGREAWWHVTAYRPPMFAYISPGLFRPHSAGYFSIVPVSEKTRRLLPNKMRTGGVTPEYFIENLIDWRESVVIMKRA